MIRLTQIILQFRPMQSCLKFNLSTFSNKTPEHKGLKNYFNNRIELSNVDLLQILESLKNNGKSYQLTKDHRFIHLVTRIETHLKYFGLSEKLRIAKALTKLNYTQQLLKTVINDLSGSRSMNLFSLDQLASIIYIVTKSKKISIQLIKNISDIILTRINGEKTVYLTSNNKIINNENKNDKQAETIQYKNLVNILWSLYEMKITDKILSDCILKQYIKPNLSEMPTELIPFFLGVLVQQNMTKKRIFDDTINILKDSKRQKKLQTLRIDQLKSLVCTICKSESQHRNLILWLLQTLVLKLKSSKQINNQLTQPEAYQIVYNLKEANIYDRTYYKFLLNIIQSDVQKIEPKQVVRLISILLKFDRDEFEGQCDQLGKYIWGKFQFFMNRYDVDHSTRKQLRDMIVKKKLNAPNKIMKIMVKEQREYRRVSKNKTISQQKKQHVKAKSQPQTTTRQHQN